MESFAVRLRFRRWYVDIYDAEGQYRGHYGPYPSIEKAQAFAGTLGIPDRDKSDARVGG